MSFRNFWRIGKGPSPAELAGAPKSEKAEVLGAFTAHKDEVTAGYVAGKPD